MHPMILAETNAIEDVYLQPQCHESTILDVTKILDY